MEGWFVIISHIEACTFRQKFSNKKKESKKMDVNWIYDNIYYTHIATEAYRLDRAHIWITELIDFVFTFGCVMIMSFQLAGNNIRCLHGR